MPTKPNGNRWLGKYVPYLLYRITNQLNRRLRRRLKNSGINLARWRVLAVLKDNGQMNIGQIVRRTVNEQPTVSRIVDQLEREGLAVRETSDTDSRIVQVSLTREGHQAFKEIYPTATGNQELALQGFTKQDIRALIGFLERIQENIISDEDD